MSDIQTSSEEQIARKFMTKFIKSVAKSLHESTRVEFNVFSLDTEMETLLDQICFNALVSFESENGVEIEDESYYFRPAYRKTAASEQASFVIGKTFLHGYDDPEFNAAISELEAEPR